MNEKQNRLKIVIIVLSVLLSVSTMALAGILLYHHFASDGPASVMVPDNIIIPEPSGGETPRGEESIAGEILLEEEIGADESMTSTFQTETTAPERDDTRAIATALYLHNHNPGDSSRFHAANLFPGDSETKYFCVQASYKDTVTVKCRAQIRPGYEKLAEVLKCRIVLLTSGQTLYNGLMRDMPESLNHTLDSAEGTTEELYYDITAYLDTAVGNEYQGRELVADFRWWIEETDHLADPPQTGDDSHLIFWLSVMSGSLFLLILLFVIRKKGERDEQYR